MPAPSIDKEESRSLECVQRESQTARRGIFKGGGHQDPIAAIHGLGRWINYIHAKDAKKTGDRWRSTFLGNGSLPLRGIIAALDATGKTVPFCFEFPGEGDPEGAIRKSLEFVGMLGQ